MGSGSEALIGFSRKIKLPKALLAIFVPFLILFTPNLFSINGIGPSWETLWLLPWALENGPLKGCIAGGCLGLIVDSISISNITHIPALLILGFYWGRFGREGLSEISGFGLGIFASTGTALIALISWIQHFGLQNDQYSSVFNAWSIHITISQMIITGALAPVLCSWLLSILKGPNSSKIL